MITTIRITNLRLRAIIGAHEWERTVMQDVVINLTLDYDAARAVQTDRLADTLNYKTLTKRIITEVEQSRFHLLESLAAHLLSLAAETPLCLKATVRVDKPGALRYADSVSVEMANE